MSTNQPQPATPLNFGGKVQALLASQQQQQASVLQQQALVAAQQQANPTAQLPAFLNQPLVLQSGGAAPQMQSLGQDAVSAGLTNFASGVNNGIYQRRDNRVAMANQQASQQVAQQNQEATYRGLVDLYGEQVARELTFNPTAGNKTIADQQALARNQAEIAQRVANFNETVLNSPQFMTLAPEQKQAVVASFYESVSGTPIRPEFGMIPSNINQNNAGAVNQMAQAQNNIAKANNIPFENQINQQNANTGSANAETNRLNAETQRSVAEFEVHYKALDAANQEMVSNVLSAYNVGTADSSQVTATLAAAKIPVKEVKAILDTMNKAKQQRQDEVNWNYGGRLFNQGVDAVNQGINNFGKFFGGTPINNNNTTTPTPTTFVRQNNRG